MVDLQWDLLTNSSQNLGNALTNAAGQVRQHRETATTRNALTNYLTNPDDQAAFTGYARRDPRGAIQIRDEHIQAARGLRAEHQQQLETLGQILRNQDGTPITAEQYPQALQLARQAGIDTTGHEAYDPDFVTATVGLYNRLHPVAPVTVAEGARLINPQTGQQVANNPARPRYYPVAPGGQLQLDPSFQGPTTDAPPVAQGDPPEFIHNRQTGQTMRLNRATNQYEPYTETQGAAPASSDLQNWRGAGSGPQGFR